MVHLLPMKENYGYGMVGDDYEGPPIFDDDQYEEESMPVYDTDIEDVIEEEEGFIEKGGFGGKEDNIEDSCFGYEFLLEKKHSYVFVGRIKMRAEKEKLSEVLRGAGKDDS
ncbi:hypothetical protein Tco_1127715 [Tanacetum coccineum]